MLEDIFNYSFIYTIIILSFVSNVSPVPRPLYFKNSNNSGVNASSSSKTSIYSSITCTLLYQLYN